MPNRLTGSTYYIDSTGVLDTKNFTLQGVVVTATAAGAILKLKDLSLAGTMIDLRVATSGESKHFDFSTVAMTFPNGLEVEQVTNCVAAAFVRKGGG